MVSTPRLAAPAAGRNRAETHRRARTGGGAASQAAGGTLRERWLRQEAREAEALLGHGGALSAAPRDLGEGE